MNFITITKKLITLWRLSVLLLCYEDKKWENETFKICTIIIQSFIISTLNNLTHIVLL